MPERCLKRCVTICVLAAIAGGPSALRAQTSGYAQAGQFAQEGAECGRYSNGTKNFAEGILSGIFPLGTRIAAQGGIDQVIISDQQIIGDAHDAFKGLTEAIMSGDHNQAEMTADEKVSECAEDVYIRAWRVEITTLEGMKAAEQAH